MAEFTAKWSAMLSTSEEIKSCASEIKKCGQAVKDIQRSLYFSNQTTEAIKEAVNKQTVQLDNISNKCRNMGIVLNNSALRYQSTENNILNKNNNHITVDGENDNNNKKLNKNIQKILSSFGLIGTIEDIAYNTNAILNYKKKSDKDIGNIKNIFKLTNAGVKFFDKAHSMRDGNGMAKFVGVNNKVKAEWFNGLSQNISNKEKASISFEKIINDEFGGKYKLTDGKKLSGIATWASTVFSLAGNAVSNYEEHGNKFTLRGAEETVAETGVDIVKNGLITAGVTAAMVAAFGAAPAIAVAAGSVAVSWGLDWVTKKVTKKFTGEEKEFTEAVSDYIVDGFEKGVNKVKKTAGSIASWFGMQSAYA